MERQSRRIFSGALCCAELFGEGAAGGHQRREPAAPGCAPGAGGGEDSQETLISACSAGGRVEGGEREEQHQRQ